MSRRHPRLDRTRSDPDRFEKEQGATLIKLGQSLTLPTLLQTPASPAITVLFGMVFCLAVVHFAGLPWRQTATVTFYAALSAWVAWLLWQRRASLGRFGRIDIVFVAFVTIVLISLVATQGWAGDAQKYPRYLPFLVLVPYLCGRLMGASDRDLFSRVILVAGVVMLPLLLLDRLTSAGREGARWAFFGKDHGALLVGGLLAAALLALCVRVLGCRNPDARNDRSERLVFLGLIGIVTVFLVWVMARGWLLAGLVAVAVTCLSARHRLLTTRLALLAAVLAIAGVTLVSLPRLDPVSGEFYARLLTRPPPIPLGADPAPVPSGAHPARVPIGANLAPVPVSANLAKAGPILGEASCQPFKEGINSAAIRWVLYREAMAMFKEHPYIGVGASRFGEHSCNGSGGYPHSTMLQGFAELGLMGGGLLAGLLVLAGVTLARPCLPSRQGSNWPADAFVLALFVTFAVADQIYGNYFMSVGTWLMLGMAAGIRAHDTQAVSRG